MRRTTHAANPCLQYVHVKGLLVSRTGNTNQIRPFTVNKKFARSDIHD